MKIGFIGMGIMGSRMAKNLQKAGYDLLVYNRTKSKALTIFEDEAIIADSPKELAEKSDVIFTMLENPNAVLQVAEDELGLFSIDGANKLWVDCSTVNPSFTKDIAIKAKEQGFRFLDAPVAGSKMPAEKGELVFLVGGVARDLQEVQPMLGVMGKKTVHVGENGKGASMKLLVNLMLAQSVLAFSESMALGESMDLSKDAIFNVLLNTPVVAPVVGAIRGKLESGNEDVNFPLKLMRKDLQLVNETAYENGIVMPSASIAKEVFTMAMNVGKGDSDFSSIFHFLTKR